MKVSLDILIPRMKSVQIKKVFQEAIDLDGRHFTVAINTGMRRGELSKIK